jgi:hypothetical protein
MRKQETDTSKHRGISLFRTALGDYVGLIANVWMEASKNGLEYSQAKLNEVELKGSALLEQVTPY